MIANYAFLFADSTSRPYTTFDLHHRTSVAMVASLHRMVLNKSDSYTERHEHPSIQHTRSGTRRTTRNDRNSEMESVHQSVKSVCMLFDAACQFSCTSAIERHSVRLVARYGHNIYVVVESVERGPRFDRSSGTQIGSSKLHCKDTPAQTQMQNI